MKMIASVSRVGWSLLAVAGLTGLLMLTMAAGCGPPKTASKSPPRSSTAATEAGQEYGLVAEATPSRELRTVALDLGQWMREDPVDALARLAEVQRDAGRASADLLGHPDPDVREQAAQLRRDAVDFVSSLGSPAQGEDPRLYDARRTLARAEFGDEAAIAELPRLLEVPGINRVVVLGAMIIHVPKDQWPMARIRPLVHSESEPVRLTAARMLVERGDDSGIPVLTEAASSPDPDARLHAMAAIQSVGSAAEPLREAARACLDDPNAKVRQRAQLALAGTGDPSMVAPLIELAGDHDSTLRHQALYALGEIGGEAIAEAVPLLAEALGDPSTRVRQAAAYALRRSAEYGAEAVDELRAALDDVDDDVRFFAAAELTVLGHDDGVEEIRQALAAVDEPRRIWALMASWYIDDAATLFADELNVIGNSGSEYERDLRLIVLAFGGDTSVAPELRSWQDSQEPVLRAWGLAPLVEWKVGGARVALDYLADLEDPEHREFRLQARRAQYLLARRAEEGLTSEPEPDE
jgi:HEAT repeat protein